MLFQESSDIYLFKIFLYFNHHNELKYKSKTANGEKANKESLTVIREIKSPPIKLQLSFFFLKILPCPQDAQGSVHGSSPFSSQQFCEVGLSERERVITSSSTSKPDG